MKIKSPQSAGGKARAAKLSAEERTKIAKQAISKRWEGVERSKKVQVGAKVDESTLRRALEKSGLSKSTLIDKLLTDYAG